MTARVCLSCGSALRYQAARWCGSCGAAVTTAPGSDLVLADPPASAPTKPPKAPSVRKRLGLGWWTRRRAIIAGVVAVAVAASIGGFLWWRQSGDRHAEGPVIAYFDALADGDGPAAAKWLGDAGTDSPMWGPDALRQGYQAPTHVSVTRVEYGGSERVDQRPNMEYASVSVTYRLGDETVEQTFDLSRGDGFEREWTIVRADLAAISAGDTEVTVAGAEVSGEVTVPPGVYEVTASGNELFAPVSDEVVVQPAPLDEAAPAAAVSLPVKLRDDAQDTIDGLIRGRIDDCAAADTLDWDTCPWIFDNVTKRAWAETADWTVDDYPDIDITVDGTAAVVEVTTPGTATATRTVPDGSKRSYSADLVPTGTVTIDEGDLMWTYSPQQ